MLADQSRVVVEDGVCAFCAVPIKRVRHSAFPEVRAECSTVTEGAAHLARKLTNAKESVGSDRHRMEIEEAMKDVAAFRETLADAEEEREAACRCEAEAARNLESAANRR